MNCKVARDRAQILGTALTMCDHRQYLTSFNVFVYLCFSILEVYLKNLYHCIFSLIFRAVVRIECRGPEREQGDLWRP